LNQIWVAADRRRWFEFRAGQNNAAHQRDHTSGVKSCFLRSPAAIETMQRRVGADKLFQVIPAALLRPLPKMAKGKT
jgi:hypothetical protein